MAKLVEVTWDADHIYSVEGVMLLPLPAVNRVPADETLERFLANPGVKHRVIEKKLVVGAEVEAEASSAGPASLVTPISATPSASSDAMAVPNLTALSAGDAIAAVRGVTNATILKRLRREEGRTTVLAAIDAQLAVL